MKIARRSRSRSRSRKACRSRKAGRKACRKAGRKACRSTRRRMGGAHMNVNQPSHDSFDIEINPNIEDMYNQILNHRYNHYTEKMAPTFAEQEQGTGEYIVVFNQDDATIQSRSENNMSLDDRLAALLAADDDPLSMNIANTIKVAITTPTLGVSFDGSPVITLSFESPDLAREAISWLSHNKAVNTTHMFIDDTKVHIIFSNVDTRNGWIASFK